MQIQYLNPDYLRAAINLPQQKILIIMGFFLILAVAGFIVHYLAEKRKLPRFYKRFIRWIGDFLIYLPLLIILILSIPLAGFSVANYFLVISLLIWLIWFIFLVYYRIVKVSKLWFRYHQLERKEKYQKNAK